MSNIQTFAQKLVVWAFLVALIAVPISAVAMAWDYHEHMVICNSSDPNGSGHVDPAAFPTVVAAQNSQYVTLHQILIKDSFLALMTPLATAALAFIFGTKTLNLLNYKFTNRTKFEE